MSEETYRQFDKLDPRPRTRPCPHCARDVQDGQQCICAPAERILERHADAIAITKREFNL